MEQSSWFWIVIGVFIILIGIVLLASAFLRTAKTKGSVVVDSDIQKKNGLPITPRDERVLPSFSDAPAMAQEEATDALSSMAAVAAASPVVNGEKPAQELSAKAPEQPVYQLSEPEVALPEEQALVTEPVSAFEQNSPLLDKHLSDQEHYDQDNSPLLNAKETITVVITPRNSFTGLSGQTVLSIIREYSLKYGVMSMFHRYEHENGTGDLWFSMLGANDEGVQPFDLNTLPESRFSSILLFLSLPHPHALRGFDSMVSVAQMIAEDIGADLYDEQGYPLSDGEFAKLRAIVANYQ